MGFLKIRGRYDDKDSSKTSIKRKYFKMEILELKSTSEKKNSLESLNGRFEQFDKIMTDDRCYPIIKSEKKAGEK